MKILAITNLYPSAYDINRASFNRQQFEALSREVDVDVVIPISWIDYIRCKKNKDYRSKLNIRLVPYFHIPGILISLNPVFIFISLMIFLFPYTLIKKSNVILLSWAFPDAVSGTLLARIFKKETICKIHGSDINVFSNDLLKRIMIKWAMKHAKHVISVSKSLKQKLVNIGVEANKIHVIYNGVDHNLFHPADKAIARASLNLPIHLKIILFVGNLKVSKGCIDLANAYKCTKTNNTCLIYIGAGQGLAELKSIGNDISPDKKIIFAGSVKHNTLNDWFNAADLVCLPSHNEGVPNILLEAFSCGLPAVATRVGGIPEIFCDNCGALVEVHNTSELADAIDSVLGVNYNKHEISQYANKFDWDTNINSVLNLLKDIQ